MFAGALPSRDLHGPADFPPGGAPRAHGRTAVPGCLPRAALLDQLNPPQTQTPTRRLNFAARNEHLMSEKSSGSSAAPPTAGFISLRVTLLTTPQKLHGKVYHVSEIDENSSQAQAASKAASGPLVAAAETTSANQAAACAKADTPHLHQARSPP